MYITVNASCKCHPLKCQNFCLLSNGYPPQVLGMIFNWLNINSAFVQKNVQKFDRQPWVHEAIKPLRYKHTFFLLKMNVLCTKEANQRITAKDPVKMLEETCTKHVYIHSGKSCMDITLKTTIL